MDTRAETRWWIKCFTKDKQSWTKKRSLKFYYKGPGAEFSAHSISTLQVPGDHEPMKAHYWWLLEGQSLANPSKLNIPPWRVAYYDWGKIIKIQEVSNSHIWRSPETHQIDKVPPSLGFMSSDDCQQKETVACQDAHKPRRGLKSSCFHESLPMLSWISRVKLWIVHV